MRTLRILAVAMLAAGAAIPPIAAHAASYSVVYSFKGGTEGKNPSGLIYIGGQFYGTTINGGSGGRGTVYSMTPSGVETVLYAFSGSTDGRFPESGLISLGGNFYGTTVRGGSSDFGTVFEVTPAGAETILYSFKGGTSDGTYPSGLLALGGTFYGTTDQGGSGTNCTDGAFGCGTIFSVTQAGSETTLYSFPGGSSLFYPLAGLTNIKNVLYGTASGGGINGCSGIGCGGVFSVTAKGKEKIVYNFVNLADGLSPAADLINVGGTLYGTTGEGGGTGCADGLGCGTVFSVTPKGIKKLVYAFQGGTDGAVPYNSSLVSIGGMLYGTTDEGGSGTGCDDSAGCGTIFAVTPAGTETVLHSFLGGKDGAFPDASLIYVKGRLYGITNNGGGKNCAKIGCGTVFELTP